MKGTYAMSAETPSDLFDKWKLGFEEYKQKAAEDEWAAAHKGKLEVSMLGTFPRRKKQWLIPGWFVENGLNIIDGNPGVGKSMFISAVIAHLLQVRPLAGDKFPLPKKKYHVVLLAHEDDWSEDWRPRLETLGVEEHLQEYYIHVIKHVWGPKGETLIPNLRDNLSAIVEYIRKTSHEYKKHFGVWANMLLVIDPLFSYLPKGVSTVDDASMRSVLLPLNMKAKEHSFTVLLTRHLNKNKEASDIDKGSGSKGGIIGVARSGAMVTKASADHVKVKHYKSNGSKEQNSLLFKFNTDAALETGYLTYAGEVPDKTKPVEGGVTSADQEKYTALLKKLPDTFTEKDIRVVGNLKPTPAQRLRKRLVAEKVIQETGEKRINLNQPIRYKRVATQVSG
jgi:hypothetical protein